MANRGSIVEPLVSSVALKGAAKTATFTTDGFSFNRNGARVFVWLDVTVTGTSPTLDIDLELSMDGGTTWAAIYPTTFATQAQADLDQITASGAAFNWFENGVPFGDDTSSYQMRLECTIGGTNPSFTFDDIKVGCWTPGSISVPNA